MFSMHAFVRGLAQPKKRQKTTDKRPVVSVRFNTRRGTAKPETLIALLDSGGSASLITEKFTKKLKLRSTKNGTTNWTTPAGNLQTKATVRSKFMLPELHDNRLIEWDFHVTKNMGAYDMIIGRDMLKDLGIDIQFSNETIDWDGHSIPFKDVDSLDAFHIEEPEAVQEMTSRLGKILDNNYHTANLQEVTKMQTHLSDSERKKLLQLLLEFEDLFDGTLGKWNQPDYSLKLKENIKPYHAKAFPIPRIHLETLKTEVERLCEIGVLKRVNRSEWAAPTFIIPKKDGRVRFVSDFRELNKRIKRMPYPVPNIQDMLLNLEGFQHATALDLNMGYYHIKLDSDSRKLCTIILPFGKFEYQRLPQGLCNSPDIFQEKMNELFQGFEHVRAYLDDLLVLTKSDFDDHLRKLRTVLEKLRTAGLKVNAPKSFFGRAELEYLGYWITREGIKPVPKKIEAVQKIAEPKTKKELRSFIGVVNYYRDMWVRRSHVLAPLAALTSKTAKWKWTEVHSQAFKDMKNIIAREVMLAYPNFDKPFEIHTDASHHQLGAVISQDNKPIAFYSRKLNPAQSRYTTTERELLSIVETLKEFKNILLGHKIIVHTDHKNLVCKNFNTERVMRWRLVIEEFGPELRYIKGTHNIVADALSRLDMMSSEEHADNYASEFMQAECFASTRRTYQTIPKEFPWSYAELHHEQNKDNYIKKGLREKKYSLQTFRHSDKQYDLAVRDGKIVVPACLQKDGTVWYHQALMHPGESRLELTIGQHFYWKGIRTTVKRVCHGCGVCQLQKPKTIKYGKLPEKNPDVIPWHTVCIDLIGPYTVGEDYKDNKGNLVRNQTTLHAMTFIDPATGWFEIVEVKNKRADFIANLFEQTWLNKYPWPTEVVMDRGKEFMAEVKEMLHEYGITRKPITTRNPQANAMVERAHQTIHNMIRSQAITGMDSLSDGEWTGVLTALGFAMRSTVHTTNRATASQLVFGRDAMLNVNFEANWQYIKERKQHLIRQNNKRENASRKEHVYQVGDKVLVKQDPSRKHGSERYKGPYEVSRVNDNGTLLLSLVTTNGGVVQETWNVRVVTPCKA